MTNELPQFLQGSTPASGSLVSAEASWEGKISSSGDIRVEGTVRGELQISGSLTVTPQAQIDGDVKASKIVLAGRMEGQVVCDERLELLPGSVLGGDIETGTLVVHEGAYIEANRFKMLKSELPARR